MPICKIAIDEQYSVARRAPGLHFGPPLCASNPANIVALMRVVARAVMLCEIRERRARQEELERLLASNSSVMVDLGLRFEDRFRGS
jgi:hypothetical protein